MKHLRKRKTIDNARSHCPVTGLIIHQKPEWTDVELSKGTTSTVKIVGDRILWVKASGFATKDDMIKALAIEKEALAAVKPRGAAYYQIEDWANLKGSTGEARKFLFKSLKENNELAGLFYYHVPPMFKFLLNMGIRLKLVKYNIVILENYDQAITLAFERVSNQPNGKKKRIQSPNRRLYGEIRSEHKTPPAVDQTGWHYQADRFAISFEVLTGTILHAKVRGKLKESHIYPVIRLQEKIIHSTGLASRPWYFVLGLSESEGVGQKARKQYVDAIKDLYNKHPFKMFVFYGADNLLKTGIYIARPFVPFKVSVVEDLPQAIKLISSGQVKDKTSSKTTPGTHVESIESSQKIPDNKLINHYVKEILQYIEGINWEINGINHSHDDPTHPFRMVFDTIDLIKWELDDVLKERDKAAQDLKLAKEMAEAANKAKSEFLANMSHELRTPLNHIIGFTELVVDKNIGELNPTQQEYLNDVLHSANHLLSLINDILDLSKVETGKLELQLSQVDFGSLIEKSMIIVKANADKQGNRISKQLKNVPKTIQADERKLKQIMFNLLSNAVKFSPDGGNIEITTRKIGACESATPIAPSTSRPETTSHTQTWLEIAVADSGIGLKEEDCTRIFNPFEQVERSKSRKFQGTGLGLSLTKLLVELHGGSIWAHSDGENKGTTITFTLPIEINS